MAGQRISELYKYMTLPQSAQLLGIHSAKLRRRLKDGIFPASTFVNEHGFNFFDKEWLNNTKEIMANSFEAKQ